MLSFGIDASRALATIERKLALASTSPPPERAATSICRARRAKTLPRAASAAPFACLMECHFECPLISSAPGSASRAAWATLRYATGRPRDFVPLRSRAHLLEKTLMQPQVARQLRMERRGPQVT